MRMLKNFQLRMRTCTFLESARALKYMYVMIHDRFQQQVFRMIRTLVRPRSCSKTAVNFVALLNGRREVRVLDVF